MARGVHKLSARTIETARKPGRYGDGGGLQLFIRPSGARSWVFRYRLAGKDVDLGLGNADAVPVADARDKAAEYRAMLARGDNPKDARKVEAVPTFGASADEYIAAMAVGWRNEKHVAQWSMTMAEYAAPLRPKTVDTIGTADVLAVLKPIWQDKPETASRVRGRIEAVLDAAAAKGHRRGENPARWRGHLQKLLPARQRLTRGHHAAMAFDDLPAFVAALRDREAMAARALEFLILTAARSGEVIGARWSEIDETAKVWTVPATRMKAARLHRVPLPPQAMAILDALKPLRRKADDFIFPGQRTGQPLSNMAMAILLQKRMGKGVTVHGFRSAFRDWCGETTNFPREVAEAALAHVNADKTEAAYRRGDALEKRRKLMEAWTQFVSTNKASANVVPLARAK